jgi:hypothetical protein
MSKLNAPNPANELGRTRVGSKGIYNFSKIQLYLHLFYKSFKYCKYNNLKMKVL